MAPLVTARRIRAFLLPEHGAVLWRPYSVVAAFGVLAGVLIALLEPMQALEWRVYDGFSSQMARHPDVAPDVVVVAIDEPSFAQIGLPWPWPRSLHSDLVDAIKAGGARTIALDILFDVPGRPQEDRALAESIRRAGNVVLASDLADTDDRRYSLTQWTEPIPVLAAAAVAQGVVRIPYDPDGVLRRAALAIEDRPSLALAVASRAAVFVAPADLRRSRLFRFDGPPRRGIVTVSYYQALDAAQSLPRGIFKDKHVLVGRSLQVANIDAQADHFATPVAVRMAGVEVHATLVDALLRGRFVDDPFGPWPFVVGLCVIAGALVSAASFRLGPLSAPVVAAVVVLGLFGVSYFALTRNVRVPAVAPSLAVGATYAVTAAYRYGLSARERRLIKRAFQHYVAPAIVDQMLSDPSRLRLGGQEYEVTVLFSDLEDFTRLAERVPPADLSAHLGGYFTEMLDALLAERGTLDKLIGDAIMMYFGCPIPDERHAIQACRGALAMQQRMSALNRRWRAQGLPELRTRVGINTGRAVAGNMGTDTIFNYTVVGDCVNLASRLETINKEYGTLIVAGEETWARLHDGFEGRELDWIRVKGKAKPLAIYELAGEAGRLEPQRRELFSRYAEGLAAYRRARWREAAAAFDGALEIDPNDGPSRTMKARCVHYIEQPRDAWDGVHVMDTK